MSKRNYKRLIKKQRILYKNRTLRCEDSENSEIEIVEDSEDFVEHSQDFAALKMTLRDKLKKWCIETAPSRKCAEKLLAVLKEEGLDVPLSRETQVIVRNVSPGSYCHIGKFIILTCLLLIKNCNFFLINLF